MDSVHRAFRLNPRRLQNSIQRWHNVLALAQNRGLYSFLNTGEMAEWPNAVVLKTIEPKGSEGSNPSLSAIRRSRIR